QHARDAVLRADRRRANHWCVYAKPWRPGTARFAREALGEGRVEDERRWRIDRRARRSSALWIVAHEPLGRRRKGPVGGRRLDSELAQDRRERQGVEAAARRSARRDASLVEEPGHIAADE